MSVVPLGLTALQILVDGLLGPAMFVSRSIGGFTADVTIDEDAVDELAITDFPVEQGADITDHSFVRPSRIKIQVGYSNSSQNSGGDPNYATNVYAQFLALLQSRQLFDVVTGKRSYTSMLMERLTQHTDQKVENALLMTVECRQVILTSTQTVSVPQTSNMQNPQINGPTVNGGANSLQPAPNFNSAQAVADGTMPL